ncbi:MAG: helix-turn-helix transcriptional regulator [Bacteroidota bacterium]
MKFNLIAIFSSKKPVNMNSVGKIIINARKNRGLTQEKLAEIAKINLRTVQRIENSESEPRGKTLNLICDALEIDSKELMKDNHSTQINYIGSKIANLFFLLALNLILMGVIGLMTLDSNANLNSLLGGILVSVFLPFFIVFFTKKLNGLERMLKFGFGYILYFFFIIFNNGFPLGFTTGLFPCLLISLLELYYGGQFIKTTNKT